jgi:integrase/recombinase XerD
MLDEMRMRKLAPETQALYLRGVERLAKYLGRSPDQADAEDLRRFQLHLVEQGISSTTLNGTITALRFLFETTLGAPERMAKMSTVREPRKLPVVLSVEEVTRLLDAAPNLKARAALSVAYGAGLRAAEVVSLKVGDIDSERMVIRVEQGKGSKDRYAMLSPKLLTLLRHWYQGGPGGRQDAARWVVVPGAQPHRSVVEAPTQSALSCRGAGSRARQACVAAHAASLVRDAPAGAEDRHPRDPSAARPQEARDHGALQPGGDEDIA